MKDVDRLNRYANFYEDACAMLVAPSASDSIVDALTDKELEYVEMQPRASD
ncbi:hypothetical protein [Salinarchaeum laminariae]|uniref:hypothetical protein n=1 Tax=Salinarchaeum laminariae TaxID=869888 RepID=UPI0020C1037C|nr:hypothetical protein [Salinarchaeum laminariae]